MNFFMIFAYISDSTIHQYIVEADTKETAIDLLYKSNADITDVKEISLLSEYLSWANYPVFYCGKA